MVATRSGNRYGSNYNAWVNSLRSDYSRAYERRRREEETASDPAASQINKIDRVHFYIKDNAKSHNTKKYDLIHDKEPKPVLRRGQPFYVAIRFKDRDFDVKTDRVMLNFKFGPKPSVMKDTMAVIKLENNSFTKTRDEWDARVDQGTRGKDLVIQVFAPANAKVGIWRLDIRTGLQDTSITRRTELFTDETDIFMLFNAWCKDDLVFMEKDVERDEYVMNDQGKVYVGAYRRARGRPWAFGQFDDVVLPVAMYLLEVVKLPHTERGNPVKVVRAISAAVNASDENGVLEGRWDGEYGDGIAPYKWTGSVRILEQYLKNGYEPVKYGQCWVFSALTTTICRALGIPTRSVTNFVSAHDTNSSLTIDNFFDENGDEIEGGPDGESWDSIWNFHVWNDVWMARPDLPKGYGGWQAIDATPQEESDSKMQCGPASLEAIRRGDIGLGYDAPFVFAEVNADVMHWRQDDKSDWGFSRMKINKYHVGRSLLTKKPDVDDDDGEADREDVIDEYKNKEGTSAERLAIHNAVRGSRRAQRYYEYDPNVKEDVKFDLIEIDKIEIGDTFKVHVTATNESSEPRSVSTHLTARSMYYTGVHHSILKKAGGDFTLQPGEKQDVALTIEYKEYWKKLLEHCMIKIYGICRVKETGQCWSEEDDFQVEKPKLTIEVEGEPQAGKDCKVIFSFKNPLNDEELTGCSLSIDGPGLMRPVNLNSLDMNRGPGETVIPLDKTVPANGNFRYEHVFRPRIKGKRKVLAAFNSTELFDIHGAKTIVVKKAE